jgi:hypothetical protein
MHLNAISDILSSPKAKVTRSNRVGCAKLPPFRIKLRTRGLDRPIVIGPLLAQLSGEAKLRQADIG